MRIKGICSSVTDGSHNPSQGIINSDYMMLSSKNIFDDEITFEEPRFLSEEDFERENRRTKISEGAVLLTIVGTVGRTAVVDSNMPAFTLQRSVAVLHPRKDICSGRFLMYALRGKRSYIENRAKGVAQKGIYLGEVANIDIHIPDVIPEYIKSLNWRISNVECCGNGDNYPFENTTEAFWISGTELYEMITNNANVQWIWGLLSGFRKELSREEAYDEEYVDIASEGIQSYWNKPIAPYCKNADIEIFAFDSSETYVMCNDDNIYSVLRKHFKGSNDLETQIDIWNQNTNCE